MPTRPPVHQPAHAVGAARHIGAVDERIWRLWYKRKLWTQVLRPQTLIRDKFTCQMCGRNRTHEPHRLVADHKEPHRGDWDKFIDADNLWTLCDSPCHNRNKQRLEQNVGKTRR